MAGHWLIMLGSQQETCQDTKALGPDTPKDNRICDVRTGETVVPKGKEYAESSRRRKPG
jgi:hypothetical protein